MPHIAVTARPSHPYGAALAVMVLVSVTVGRPPGAQPVGPANSAPVVGVPPKVSAAEAIRIAAEWGRWLGVEQEDLSLETRHLPGVAFLVPYEITTRDGTHIFRVDAYGGYVCGWEDTRVFTPELRAPELSPEETVVRDAIATEFIREHLRFHDMDNVRQVADPRSPRWVQFVGDDVVFLPNLARGIWVDLQRGQVCALSSYTYMPIRVDPTRLLTPAECGDIARAEIDRLGKWESVRLLPPGDKLSLWMDKYYVVERDCAGVQRLTRGFLFDVVPRGGVPQEPALQGPVGISVDARTGEIVWGAGAGVEFFLDRRYTELHLNGSAFETMSYPCRRERGVYYLYVGYLDSYIWEGTLASESEDAATLVYEGRTWELKAGEPPTVDGERVAIRARPRTLGGYLYVPISLIEPITGWKARYEPRFRRVHLESPEYRARLERDER